MVVLFIKINKSKTNVMSVDQYKIRNDEPRKLIETRGKSIIIFLLMKKELLYRFELINTQVQ